MKLKYKLLKRKMDTMNLSYFFKPYNKNTMIISLDNFSFHLLEKNGTCTPNQFLTILQSLDEGERKGIVVHAKNYESVFQIFLSGFVCEKECRKIGEFYFIPVSKRVEYECEEIYVLLKYHLSIFLDLR